MFVLICITEKKYLVTTDKLKYKRPYITLSAASSLDGYISTINGDSRLSNSKDWNRVHELRSKSDAIIVGSGTIRIDDSKLTIDEKYFQKKPMEHPIRVVVSSKGNIPLNARVITYKSDIPTFIAITSQCSKDQKLKLEKSGCKVIKCGKGPLVNLQQLLHILKTEYSIHNVMLEGGSRLNGEMLHQKLIDEVHLAIAPVICGKGVPFFTLPKTISSFAESPFFKIIRSERINDMVFLKIIIQYKQRDIT